MSSDWLPEHRQLFFQIFEEGPKFRGIVLMLVPRRRTRDFLKRIVFARYGQSSGAATPWSRRLLMVITMQ